MADEPPSICARCGWPMSDHVAYHCPVDDPPSESRTFTLVVHLPQRMSKFTKLLTAIGALWPGAKFEGDLTRLEIPADDRPDDRR